MIPTRVGTSEEVGVFGGLGKLFVLTGVILVLLGLVLWIGKLPGLGFLGRLPGDLRIGGKNFVIYIPLATSILLSVLLTLLLAIIGRR
jgi:hypothetical protein